MNNNFLFKFLNNIAENMQNYDYGQTLDFTKKEDVDKLDNAIKEIQDNEFFSSIFGNNFLTDIQEKAHKIYNDAHKKKTPVRPSTNVSDNVKNNIRKLATEYVNTTINPYVKDMTNEQCNEIIDSLFEFGCWMYQK